MELPSADELRRQADDAKATAQAKEQADFDEVVETMRQVRSRSAELGIAPRTDTAWISDDEPLMSLTGWQVFCGANDNWDLYLKITTDGRIFSFRQPNSDEGRRLRAQDCEDGYFGDYGAHEFTRFNAYDVDLETFKASVLSPQQWAGATGSPIDLPQPADWYADPTGRHQHRYWDGGAWTAHVADNGDGSTDPI